TGPHSHECAHQGSTADRRQGVRRRTRGHGIGQRQGTGMGAGGDQVRDDGVATHTAAHLPQAPHLMREALAVFGRMAVAAAVATLVAVVSLVAISRVEWPAYNSSNQLHALTTVGQFGCLAGLLASGLLWRR